MVIVVHQFLKKTWLEHEFVHLHLAVDFVVVSYEEVINIVIMCFRLIVLYKTEQAVGHDEPVWQNHELRFTRLHHFIAPTQVIGGKVNAFHMLLEMVFV